MVRFSILLGIACLISIPSIRTEDDNMFMDLASSLLQNMGDGGNNNMNGLAAIGNLVGNMMQGDNAKNLGAMFGQAAGNGNAGDILSGLGSLLGGQDGKIDPSLIGSMISMFAQQMGTTEAPKPARKKRENTEGELNLDSMMNLASGLLGNQNTGGGFNAETVMPLIMNTLSSLSDTEAQKRAVDHKDHASFLPPFLERIHLYWDLFSNSQLGKNMWEKSGLKEAFKIFTSPDGHVSFQLIFRNFENHSFRRHWIKAAAKRLADYVVHVAKPEVYKGYLISAEYLTNSFLDSRGFPKNTHLNLNNPEKSMTALLNYVLKNYLDMDIDIEEYVVPAVQYIKQTLKMAEATTKKLATRGDYNALTDRMTDTLNLEVIEPVLRVYRAYKHSVKAPHCQQHLMCLVNRHNDQDKRGLPGFKAGLTKLSSVVASAALSYHNKEGFFDLYNAIQKDVNCEEAYPADCSAFHEHEMKVTTEFYHSEL